MCVLPATLARHSLHPTTETWKLSVYGNISRYRDTWSTNISCTDHFYRYTTSIKIPPSQVSRVQSWNTILEPPPAISSQLHQFKRNTAPRVRPSNSWLSTPKHNIPLRWQTTCCTVGNINVSRWVFESLYSSRLKRTEQRIRNVLGVGG